MGHLVNPKLYRLKYTIPISLISVSKIKYSSYFDLKINMIYNFVRLFFTNYNKNIFNRALFYVFSLKVVFVNFRIVVYLDLKQSKYMRKKISNRRRKYKRFSLKIRKKSIAARNVKKIKIKHKLFSQILNFKTSNYFFNFIFAKKISYNKVRLKKKSIKVLNLRKKKLNYNYIGRKKKLFKYSYDKNKNKNKHKFKFKLIKRIKPKVFLNIKLKRPLSRSKLTRKVAKRRMFFRLRIRMLNRMRKNRKFFKKLLKKKKYKFLRRSSNKYYLNSRLFNLKQNFKNFKNFKNVNTNTLYRFYKNFFYIKPSTRFKYNKKFVSKKLAVKIKKLKRYRRFSYYSLPKR